METRGRGREARASTDKSQFSTTSPGHREESSTSLPVPHFGQSRSRTRSGAVRPISCARSPVPSTATPVVGFFASSSQASQRAQSKVPIPGRSKRLPSSKKPSITSVSDSTIRVTPQPHTAHPSPDISSIAQKPHSQTRKRTRSFSRRLGSQSASKTQPSCVTSSQDWARTKTALPPRTAALTLTASALAQPLKRVRKGICGSRSPRLSLTQSEVGKLSGSGELIDRRCMDMDPSYSENNNNQERPEQENVKTEDDVQNVSPSDIAGSNTLQGLLRRLGADLHDIFPGSNGASHSHSRMQELRQVIVCPEDEKHLIGALSELCEFLSVGSEESLVSFSVNLFVAPLVHLLRTSVNIEVRILSARALTHMMDAIPSSSSSIANQGAARPLCENLLSIEYIDLAEQSLSALHKLSIDYPQQVASANGFKAVLSYLDFFSIGMQRVAAATACNLCRIPRADAMDMISDVLPTMLSLIDSDDQRIRESAVLGFMRLAESFRQNSSRLEVLCGDGAALVRKVINQLIPTTMSALSPQAYSSALRLLTILARGSCSIAIRMFSMNSLVLKMQTKLDTGSITHALDCLKLADAMLPDIPESQVPITRERGSRRHCGMSHSTSQTTAHVERREGLQMNLLALQFFGQTLFSTVMRFYVSSADANARKVCLSVLAKYVLISPADIFHDIVFQNDTAYVESRRLFSSIRFCPFISMLLHEDSSPHETLIGLAIADSAVQKLPSLQASFVREGVVHEIIRLASFTDDTNDTQSSIGEGEGKEVPAAVLSSSVIPTVQPSPSNVIESLSTSLPRLTPDSVWSVVAALHHGNAYGGQRSDIVAGVHRSQPRSSYETGEIKSLQLYVSTVAQSILEKHFGTASNGLAEDNKFENPVLTSLKRLSNCLLSVASSSSSSEKEVLGMDCLSQMVKLLTVPAGLTIFEIVQSGLIKALAMYLNPFDIVTRNARLLAFLQYLKNDDGRMAFSAFLGLTLGVLSSEEKLHVLLTQSGKGSAPVSVSSGLRQLAQPFKLRLQRAPNGEGGERLLDYSSDVVLIEPLATMTSVQDFLLPKVRVTEKHTCSVVRRSPSSRLDRLRTTGSILSNEENPTAGIASSSRRNEQQVYEPYEEQDSNDLTLDIYAGKSVEDMTGDRGDEADQNRLYDDVSSTEENIIERDAGGRDDGEQDLAESFDRDHFDMSLQPFELHPHSLSHASSDENPIQDNFSLESSGAADVTHWRNGDHSRKFRSYAAALAANVPNSSAKVSHGAFPNPQTTHRKSTPCKLVLTLGGMKVQHNSSILSAILQSAAAEGCNVSPRLWLETHTLVYAMPPLLSESEKIRESEKCQEVSNENSRSYTCIGSRQIEDRPQRLSECREKPEAAIPEHKKHKSGPSNSQCYNVVICKEKVNVPTRRAVLDLDESVASVIKVLKDLRWIHEKLTGYEMYGRGASNLVQGVQCNMSSAFHSDKLRAKLLRQLSDPLVLCGSAIPAWCFSLCRLAPFLLPFETRRMFFESTSLGVGRALHLLQSRVESSGGETHSHRGLRGSRTNETRIGRIPRQKVRLHRDRILESAIKTMSLYGSQGTTLEIEYFNEVGTGLGPTLEFYTIASREIQRVDLALWRCQSEHVNNKRSTHGKHHISDNNACVSDAMTGHYEDGTTEMVKTVEQPTKSATERASSGHSHGSGDYIIPTGNGLYPSCLPSIESRSRQGPASESIALFHFVGRLLGKALTDGRLLDLRFSKTFSRLILAYCNVVFQRLYDSGVSDVGDFSINVGSWKPVLEEFNDSTREEVWKIFTDGESALDLLADVDAQLSKSLADLMDLTARGEKDAVSTLCLTYVLPGDDEIELIKGGSEVQVTAENVEDFIRKVVFYVLFRGIQEQTEALLKGLGEVLDVRSLLVFQSSELEQLVCGPRFEEWSVEFLLQATCCDHGFSHDSDAIKFFLRTLSEMDQLDQQRFVTFATGSPALPVGGLRYLKPKLTIVRRESEPGVSADECLPTVMTCTNYLKLPDYSSLNTTRKQVLYAIREGQGSFHLS